MRLLPSTVQAVFLSGFTPRRIALANRDTSLRRAYLVHWLGLVLACAVNVTLYSLDRDASGDLYDLWTAAVEAGPLAVLVWLAVLVLVELGFGLAALLLLPWGDARAAVQAVARHALRTVWLHTGHLGLALAPLALIGMVVDNLFYGFGSDEVLPPAFAAGAAWYVVALLRAVTIELPPPETNPPMCEACGYNLSYHQDPSARCPECGRPVALSLGEDARGPVRWGPFATADRHTGFFSAAWRAWLDPERFFRGVSAYTGLWSAGAFLLIQMALTAGGFLAVMTLGVLVNEGIPWRYLGEVVYLFAWMAVFVGTLFGLGVCLAAAVIGLIVSKQEGRNCLGGTLRVACFCAGIVPVWVSCQMVAVWVVAGIVDSPSGRFIFLVPIGFVGLAALLVVLYVGGVARRVRYVRYANT